MKTVRTVNNRTPIGDRLSLKLFLLFAGSFLGVLVLVVLWTLLLAVGDSRVSAAESEIQTPALVIDPKLQSDLSKALVFDAIPTEATVQNPFIDRANIGSNLTVTSAPASSTAAVTTAGRVTTTGTTQVGPRAPNYTRLDGNTPAVVSQYVDNTRERWAAWAERANRGESVGPESETLGLDDLVPVGYAGGGDRPMEVMLYSMSLCRTFSFAAGTRFFDGVLYEINQNEVLFTNPGGLRRKSYASVNPCQGNSQTMATGNQP
jgi:hypothetical protein